VGVRQGWLAEKALSLVSEHAHQVSVEQQAIGFTARSVGCRSCLGTSLGGRGIRIIANLVRCQAATTASIGPAAEFPLAPDLLGGILDGPTLTIAAPASVVPVALHRRKVAIFPATGHKVIGITFLLTTSELHRFQAG